MIEQGVVNIENEQFRARSRRVQLFDLILFNALPNLFQMCLVVFYKFEVFEMLFY